MKRILIYLLIVSFGFNIYFIVRKIKYIKKENEKNEFFFIKKISHKEGFLVFKERMKDLNPEFGLNKRTSLIYFWDSTNYDFVSKRAMKSLDSLASVMGKYKFNYFFVTDMGEIESKQFLERSGVSFANFKTIGNMNDFMSGVYNENPVKLKKIFLVKGNKNNKSNDIAELKVKPYYLLMNKNGEIIYHNYKYYNPIFDSLLIKHLFNSDVINNLRGSDK